MIQVSKTRHFILLFLVLFNAFAMCLCFCLFVMLVSVSVSPQTWVDFSQLLMLKLTKQSVSQWSDTSLRRDWPQWACYISPKHVQDFKMFHALSSLSQGKEGHTSVTASDLIIEK